MTDREKFEAWLTRGASELSKMLLVDKFESGGYTNNVVRIQWEAWQAALASQQPADDGWVEWAGGECPVKNVEQVAIKFRSGIEENEHEAPEWWDWSHRGTQGDIIAYRVVKS